MTIAALMGLTVARGQDDQRHETDRGRQPLAAPGVDRRPEHEHQPQVPGEQAGHGAGQPAQCQHGDASGEDTTAEVDEWHPVVYPRLVPAPEPQQHRGGVQDQVERRAQPSLA